MANNDLKGRVDLDVAGALGALKSAQRAFRDLEKASTDAGKNMTASQVRSTKAIIQEYAKLRAAQSKAVSDAIATDRKLREMERNGVNARSNSRAITGARVDSINTKTADSSVESASRTELNNRRAITEEKRQQVMLAEAENRITSRNLRDELATRRQIFREQQAANRATDDALTNMNGMRYVLADVGQSMRMLGVAAAVLPIATAATAIAWERDFANVIRTSQVTGAEIGNLKSQFVSLVTTMPVNWEELTQIGTLAGQLGIAKDQIGSFTRTTAMFSATTDVSVQDAATAFGRLNSLLPDVQGNFTMLGDSIAKVGVESVATEGQIVRITTQIAAVAGLAGFSAQEVIGLSGALASVGVPPELSRGVTTRVFADITKAVSEGGIELEKWGKFVGLSGEQFRKSWNSDASGTFLKFMDAIHDKGNAAQLAIRDLGITSVRDVPILLRLGNAISSTGVAGGLLAESFRNATDSAGEMQRQYDIISGTTSAKLQVFFQTFQALIDAIGSAALGDFANVIDDWSESLRGFTRNLEEPVRLLGSIELPFTTGEAAAGAVITAAAVAGLALLVAGIARVIQASIAGRIAIHTFRQGLLDKAAAATVASSAMNGAALANGRYAASAGLGARAAAGFRGVLSTVTSAGFAAALIGISIAIDQVNRSLEDVGSSGKDVSNAIITAKNALASLEEIEIGKGGSGNPWEAMSINAKDFVKQLELLDKTAGNDVFENLSLTVEQHQSLNAANQTIQRLNDGYQELINAGNDDTVFAHVQKLTKELDLSDEALTRLIYNTPSLNALFKETFNETGIDITEKNLLKLAREGLGGFGIATEDATADAAAFDAALEEVAAEAQASLESLAGAASSFFDFGSAIDAATEEGVLSLDKFMETIRAQAEAQVAWQKNLSTLAAQGASSAFLEYLTSMGPQAATLIQEFTANPAALAEAQAVWEAHGADAALGWARSFQDQQELAGRVGAEFGGAARLEILGKLSQVGADIPGIVAHYNAVLDYNKLHPQASFADAEAAFLAYQQWVQNKRITINAEMHIATTGAGGLTQSGANGGYFGGYDGGGYTGDGGKFDPAGVVHRGEFVFTKKATSAIGVPNLYAMMRSAQAHGYSGGGKVMSNSYVPSFGSGGFRGSGTSIATLDAASVQAMTTAFVAAMKNSNIKLYTTDRLIATSNNRGSTELARQGKN